MKIGVLIPTRGDRPLFIKQCLKLMQAQTMQPDEILVVDDPPKSKANDIAERYEIGYNILSAKGCTVIFCIEDDDWYGKDYIGTMISAYHREGQPDIFGISTTIYYSIIKKAWIKLIHPGRASMMSTVIKGGLDINFKHDPRIFTDLHLWKILKGKTVDVFKPICIGIKHGIGKCAGAGHRDTFKYPNQDPDGKYLQSIVADNFYCKIL